MAKNEYISPRGSTDLAVFRPKIAIYQPVLGNAINVKLTPKREPHYTIFTMIFETSFFLRNNFLVVFVTACLFTKFSSTFPAKSKFLLCVFRDLLGCMLYKLSPHFELYNLFCAYDYLSKVLNMS